ISPCATPRPAKSSLRTPSIRLGPDPGRLRLCRAETPGDLAFRRPSAGSDQGNLGRQAGEETARRATLASPSDARNGTNLFSILLVPFAKFRVEYAAEVASHGEDARHGRSGPA